MKIKSKKLLIKTLQESNKILKERYDELLEKFNNSEFQYFGDYFKYKDLYEKEHKKVKELKEQLKDVHEN